MSTRTIKVEALARVEGEGSLHLSIRDGQVEKVRLGIFEPPRFFEALLRGRDFREAPDITARICGICPVAYLMSACHAMEQACGVTVGGELRALRRLLYCGEWIESHILHIAMLHLPDFLGYEDSIAMAADHRELVETALRMKKAGNALMALVGGREVHPINVQVGGFYRAPSVTEVRGMRDELDWVLDASVDLVTVLAGLDFPEFEQDYEFVALAGPGEYPFNEGRLVSSKGLDEPISRYDDVFQERHEEHSTSLTTYSDGRGPVHMGPLARYALNAHHLSPRAIRAAADAGLDGPCRNPFKSILVRAVEVVYAAEEALRLIDAYVPPDLPAVEVAPKTGTGYGATEAPRGICYHRYSIDDAGLITDAKIVAPTSVNQRIIEQDLFEFVQPNLHLPDDELQWKCEQAIRNYDPCISCSTHFLKLTVDRH